MYGSNSMVSYNKASDEIRDSAKMVQSSGLLAQMRLCCHLYAVVVLLLVLALTLSAQIFPAVIGMAMLVTIYVVCLMIEFAFCGDRNELHQVKR